MSSLASRLRALRAHLIAFDPALSSGEDCLVLAEELSLTAKACTAAAARSAARAGSCGAHRAAGFTDAAEWLARTGGTTRREAKEAMATASAAERLPATQQALAEGRISTTQAKEITRAEAEAPGSEEELLRVAENADLQTLRDQARKTVLEWGDANDLRRRQHRAREVAHWRDESGMVRLRAGWTPEVGIPIVNRLDAETDRRWRLARREGRNDSWAACAADALAAMLSGEATATGRTRADIVFVCDTRAWQRGHAHPGEPVHIVNGGPVPVSAVREAFDDAFVKAVLHDGVDVTHVAHRGRHISALLRTAVDLGPPPDFDGRECSVAGCGRRNGLDDEHTNPLATGGTTSLDNLAPMCGPHHREKTERERQAGLFDRAPDDPDPP